MATSIAHTHRCPECGDDWSCLTPTAEAPCVFAGKLCDPCQLAHLNAGSPAEAPRALGWYLHVAEAADGLWNVELCQDARLVNETLSRHTNAFDAGVIAGELAAVLRIEVIA